MVNGIQKYAPIALIIALLGEINFYPYSNTLRISLGIVILNLILLVREDIKPFWFTVLCGFLAFVLRTGIMGFFEAAGLVETLVFVMPALFYYVCYGTLITVFKPLRFKSNFLLTVGALASVDAVSNTLEAAVRGQNMEIPLKLFIIAGLIRAMAAYFLFMLWERQELYILSREHQKRYSQLNAFFANVESELFYLQKSADDIESIMSKAHQLYQELKAGEHKELSLEIAKDIHEVKKDYMRVTNGFENLMRSSQNIETLRIEDIFSIMKTNYSKRISELAFSVKIIFEHRGDDEFKAYLKIFTILNNLVDNAIAACKDGDRIHVSYERAEAGHIFRVVDTGTGIQRENIECIFEPGYTSKFDPVTGKSGTGIGLTHVKNTVEALKGSIDVESIPGTGTRFTVVLPIDHENG